ncbi:DEAD-box ATP-dependent RNA helicase 32 [Hirschfeldia incana]|nr:DEAD-box ATP-dependent RNA helicase 32 [Hirschfeldia incana]
MGRPKKTRGMKKQMRLAEEEEIPLLNQWIESQKPDSGSNPLALGPLPKGSKIGKLEDDPQNGAVFSRYAGAKRFDHLPLSDKTKRGLKEAKFVDMQEIQRAALPHALCGRDILGAAKTGSGKTLAFVIPILEKLHKEKWGPEDGVGCIIISPTRELAAQTFSVLNKVGKFHKFSAGLLIGGREGVDVEKERVNEMNILVCAPGRLLQHMDETPNFECSNLKILILDEADRVLDSAFRGQLDPIISQLPKRRQTLLFSATQTKKVKDLARLSLRDPEYISVHAESLTATPSTLVETVMIVPVEKKLDMLWSFIKSHLHARILVFLSTKKQVKFVHEAFNKLRPGIPLKSLHGKMSQEKRMGVYSQFIEKQSVLFCTDVLSRGLDFDKLVDWVVQVDCPEDVASYIHRVGRTARCENKGKSLLFLTPSEEKMIERLQDAKVTLKFIKPKSDKVLEISRQLSSLLVSFPDLQTVAQRAFITYLKSIHKRRDKEIFDVSKLSIEDFSASLGLPFTPKIRFANLKTKKGVSESSIDFGPEDDDDAEDEDNVAPPRVVKKKDLLADDSEEEDFALRPNEEGKGGEKSNKDEGVPMPGTRVSKNKKLKISQHRPSGTRVKFDEEGNPVAPLAIVAATTGTEVALDEEAKKDYYKKLGEQLRKVDNEDKKVEREKRREKRMKAKIKRKQGDMEEEEEEEEGSASSEEETGRKHKKAKKTYFDDNGDGDEEKEGGKINTDSISVAELEEMALKLITQS